MKCERCGAILSDSDKLSDHTLNGECTANMIHSISIAIGLMACSLQEIERVMKEVADTMLGEETE